MGSPFNHWNSHLNLHGLTVNCMGDASYAHRTRAFFPEMNILHEMGQRWDAVSLNFHFDPMAWGLVEATLPGTEEECTKVQVYEAKWYRLRWLLSCSKTMLKNVTGSTTLLRWSKIWPTTATAGAHWKWKFGLNPRQQYPTTSGDGVLDWHVSVQPLCLWQTGCHWGSYSWPHRGKSPRETPNIGKRAWNATPRKYVLSPEWVALNQYAGFITIF